MFHCIKKKVRMEFMFKNKKDAYRFKEDFSKYCETGFYTFAECVNIKIHNKNKKCKMIVERIKIKEV
jgi:hypothetical protein